LIAFDDLILSGTKEIDPDDLEIKETLGSGQFGVRKMNLFSYRSSCLLIQIKPT